MNGENNGDIQVVCRFRPLNSKEQELDNTICIDFPPDNKTAIISQENGSPLSFKLDYIFKPGISQEEVYKTCAKSVVESVLEGYNGTILAYGQTSSGKTYTMTGSNLTDYEQMGIIPRMVVNLFDCISASGDHLEFTVKLSYCEIYMERIKDLLDPAKKDLKIHEDKFKGVYISDLSDFYVSSESEVYDLIKQGTENREVAFTNMNAGSSRSHAIVVVTISQTNTKSLCSKVGKLYLVDLAGSEKISKTGASGRRLEEAKTINKSLTVLGLVINNLTDGKSSHIPYRDSKLTRILQESLGGNSKTSLIVTCSPSVYNVDETVSTLRFGVRAKSVKNKAKVNREFTVAELKLLLSKANEEIEKKNIKIDVLEEQLKNPEKQLDNHVFFDSKLDLEGLFEEIEGLKVKLDEECKSSSEARTALAQQEYVLQEYSLDKSSMVNELKQCHEEILSLKTSLSEKTEKVFELSSANELYELKIKELNFNLANLEQTVNEREVEIARLKTQIHFRKDLEVLEDGKSENANNVKLDLFMEKEKCLSLARQIEILKDSLDEMIKKKAPDLIKVREGLMKEIEAREEARWAREKEILNNDLQNRIKKVIELELILDDSKEDYRCLEQKISQGDRVMIKRNEILEKNIEHITGLYYQLLNEKCKLGVENQVLQSKAVRDFEKITQLEEKIFQYENFRHIDENHDDLSRLDSSKASRSSLVSVKIRKPIKGGVKRV